MRLPALLISDLHLVADVSCDYRWGLFPWVNDMVTKHRVKTVLILGDLTDAKDNHSAELVNKIVSHIGALAASVNVVILTGNHDWLKQGHEFFKFLNTIPGVRFITEPTEDMEQDQPSAYYLPYSKQPMVDWKGMDFSHYDYLFMHQTVSGSIASNGQEMEGEELPELNAMKVYSGDIHVPQIIKGVEYVGSPYHVHFGDSFIPRAVLLDRAGRPTDLHFETISRVTLRVTSLRHLKRLALHSGDQIKLRVELSEEDKHNWARIRRDAVEYLGSQKVIVHGVELIVQKTERRLVDEAREKARKFDPTTIITQFVQVEELGGEALDVALEVVENE